MTDDELTSDRTIRILTPTSRVLTENHVKRSSSQEFLLNGNRKEKMIVTSTCLDDDQMVNLSFFNRIIPNLYFRHVLKISVRNFKSNHRMLSMNIQLI